VTPHTAIVADADPSTLAETVRVLASAGFMVSHAATFALARQQLASVRPDVLVTAVRLDGFSGLHLVIAGRARQPDLVSVVTHGGVDPALQAEAAAQDAVYLSAPLDPELLLHMIAQALEARGPRVSTGFGRRWPRKKTVARVDATMGDCRAVVVDVSYGGALLQLTHPATEQALTTPTIRIGGIELPLRARGVWNRSGGTNGPWWYGLELDGLTAFAASAWQDFVDAIA